MMPKNPSPGPSPKKGGEKEAAGRGPATPCADQPGSAPPPFLGEGVGGRGGLSAPPTEGPVRPERVVRGQRVDEGKVLRAKQLRREMTPAERALWSRIRANRLDNIHFRRQQVIDGFIADFYSHRFGVVVELDGPVHDLQRGYDAERDRIFAARGIVVLWFSNDEVFGAIEQVLRVITTTCRNRARYNPSP